MSKNMNALRGYARLVAPVAAGALAAGCTTVGPSGEGKGTSDQPAAAETSSATPRLTTQIPWLRFTDLGGGSPIIQVYRGPGESAADKASNGAYNDGDERPIDCHTTGRAVTSVPGVGEQFRKSTDWYLLAGVTPRQYASGTYGEVVPPGIPVRECPPSTPPPGS